MKNDEQERKKQETMMKKSEQNNETLWKIEKKQWKLMKNKETMTNRGLEVGWLDE